MEILKKVLIYFTTQVGGPYPTPHGKRAIEIVGRKESAIAQVVKAIVAKTYPLTFSVGDASNSCKGSMIIEAYAGGRDTVKVPYESNKWSSGQRCEAVECS